MEGGVEGWRESGGMEGGVEGEEWRDGGGEWRDGEWKDGGGGVEGWSEHWWLVYQVSERGSSRC